MLRVETIWRLFKKIFAWDSRVTTSIVVKVDSVDDSLSAASISSTLQLKEMTYVPRNQRIEAHFFARNGSHNFLSQSGTENRLNIFRCIEI